MVWESCEPTAEEMAAARREAIASDAFDRRNFKRGVWKAVAEGRGRIVCRRLVERGGERARVVALLPNGAAEPEWEFWGRVFQWFGAAAGLGVGAPAGVSPPTPSPSPWRVTFFAAAEQRKFPGGRTHSDLGPEHVNGGYTTPCSTAGIFIYRAEEATRVLIHELVHAACLDEPGWPVEMREAMVETWAELILIALRSGGDPAAAGRLWATQSQWVADTNWKAAQQHGVNDMSDYAWRYLCGREQMYARLGIQLPAARPAVAARMESVRFTAPALGV